MNPEHEYRKRLVDGAIHQYGRASFDPWILDPAWSEDDIVDLAGPEEWDDEDEVLAL